MRLKYLIILGYGVTTITANAAGRECSSEMLLLQDAIRGFCPDQVEEQLGDLELTAIKRASWVYDIDAADRKWLNTADDAPERFKKTTQALLDFHKEKCPEKGTYVGKEPCRIVKHIQARIKNMAIAERNDIAMKNPVQREQIMAGRICGPLLKYRDLKGAIDEERERGKISGFVDAGKLKKWGDWAFGAKKEADRAIASYKSEFEKDFDEKRCGGQ